MANPETYNFQNHKKGDTFKAKSFEIIIETKNTLGEVISTAPLNLTGARIRMHLKLNNRPETIATKIFDTLDSSIIITSPLNGKFEIVEQVIDIPAAVYVYDTEIILQSGEIDTYMEGKWQILQDVTNG